MAVLGTVSLALAGSALGAGGKSKGKGKGPAKAKLVIKGTETFKRNAYIKDSVHFVAGTLAIRSGGTVTLTNTTDEPHTFSIVKPSQLPRTVKQIRECGVCREIAKSHGVNPEGPPLSGPPPIPLVNVGPEGFDESGDSIVTMLLIIYGLTEVTDVSFVVQILVSLIGLGVAIDYALLIVVRWREERQQGSDSETAVVSAMERAGRAVVFSGSTAAVGLFALVVLPVPFLRSIGYGGMLIPLVSILVAVTLLPVILATIGPRLDWPRIRHEDRASRFWTGWGELVVRHRGVAIIAALAVLIALIIPATHLYPGDPRADSLSRGGAAKTGLTALERSGIGPGVLTPFRGARPRRSRRRGRGL
jgi:hypothetical protein